MMKCTWRSVSRAGARAAFVAIMLGTLSCGVGGKPRAQAPTTDQSDSAASTVTETTVAPTTEPSTTEPPTTDAPSTEPPTTHAPTTDAPTTEGAGSSNPAEGTYQVTLEGQVSGNRFTRAATITVAPTVTDVTENGLNPVEICVRSGFPAGVPEVGAIWYGTNAVCFPTRGANLDLAHVTVQGGSVTVAPDPNIAATLNNAFTAAAGVAACIYAPNAGEARLEFGSDGSVQGSIEVEGFGGTCNIAGTTATYQATVSGRLG